MRVLIGAFTNLYHGARVALGLSVSPKDFYTSSIQIVLAILLGAFLLYTQTKYGAGAAISRDWLPIWSYSLLYVCALFILGTSLAMTAGFKNGTLQLSTVVVFSLPLPMLSLYLFVLSNGYFPSLGTFSNLCTWYVLLSFSLAWHLFTIARSIKCLALLEENQHTLRPLVVSFLLVFGLLSNLYYDTCCALYLAEPDETSEEDVGPELNVENVFAAQDDRLKEALKLIPYNSPKKIELYTVLFAASDSQDVFKQEVEVGQKIIKERYGPFQHELTLVNHPEHIESTPIASVSNLKRVLGGLAEKIDIDKDILFLYITGHGSQDAEVSVTLEELPLNNLTGIELSSILEQFKFRWRIIVVSACHSGSFIPHLANDRTLVITAAAADRKSFGCGKDERITYFGHSFFEIGIKSTFSLPHAFDLAKHDIEKREAEQGLTPSMPQVSLGSAISEKLREFQKQLHSSSPK